MMAGTTGAFGWRDADGASESDSDIAPPGGRPEDDLSSEDAAWVDSCLVKDDDNDDPGGDGKYLSDDSWAALTEAFIAALASTSGTATNQDEEKADEAAVSARGGSGGSTFEDTLMSENAAGSGPQVDAFEEPSSPTASSVAATFHDQPSPTLGDAGAASGRGPSTVTAQFTMSAEEDKGNGRLNAAAVVTGNDYPVEQGYADADEEFPVASGEEVDEVELTKDVFRVWELDVPDEEDEDEEFSRQVKKALEGGRPVGAVTPLGEDQGKVSEDWKVIAGNTDLEEHRLDRGGAVLGDEELEELITVINDMTLRPSSTT